MSCRRSLLRCSCHEQKLTPNKERVRVKGTDGRERTVTRNTTVSSVGDIDWCMVCRCRVMSGRCTNVTCSTRRP